MYYIKKHKHGITIGGPVPVTHVNGVFGIFKADDLEILDLAIASHLGVTFAATTVTGSVAWREELGIENAEGETTQDIPQQPRPVDNTTRMQDPQHESSRD